MCAGSAAIAQPGAATVATTNPTGLQTNNVIFTDSNVVLKHTSVERGTVVIFLLHNRSSVWRNFLIGGAHTPYLAPGSNTRLTLGFVDRGRYKWSSNVEPGAASPTANKKATNATKVAKKVGGVFLCY
jgi:hypothetical protein